MNHCIVRNPCFKMKFIDILKSNISTSTILNVIVQIMLYFIGLLINAKIILTCWQSRKHNKSWQLHILYSASCIVLFIFNIPFGFFSTAAPDLSRITGEWFCYLAIFINVFLAGIILTNSAMVSITKYIFVVHWDMALVYGHEKIQWASTILSLLITCFMAILHTALKRYDGTVELPLYSCFGSESDESREGIGLKGLHLTWCFSENLEPNGQWRFIHMALQILCTIAHVVYGIICCNLPEAFFYYHIFRTTNR